ncbi:MAG: type II toxin-antitoxin system Phd/YefM family antitoxin [Firmicutes bacterium]|nr:type II toxin-antitoxin system Phd/YefM family antitoxin [Bacillota bacterium]
MYRIVPSADLRNKYSQIAQFVKEKHEPLVLTKNGEGDLIVMSIELFEEKNAELKLYKRLAENKIDIAKGNFLSASEVSKQLSSYIRQDNTDLINELRETYLKARETE